MTQHVFLNPLRIALRFYAGLALALVLFQAAGLTTYAMSVWPSMREAISTAQVTYVSIAVVLVLARSVVWIRIYWIGAGALTVFADDVDSPQSMDLLIRKLAQLTRLLVASCLLDMFFLPAFFLIDVFLPFPIAGWQLGAIEMARLLLPQAFGFAALILAFLTHQFGQVLRERSEMKREAELTI
ncbi:MAG: hypothetical protein GY906_30330 [bacterium]|nr:hypothetical protein [bacterium]